MEDSEVGAQTGGHGLVRVRVRVRIRVRVRVRIRVRVRVRVSQQVRPARESRWVGG